jgi:hypothetical protein
MRKRSLALGTFGATLLLGACSTAEYGKPINEFATATDEAATVLSQLNAQVAQAYGGVLESSILNRRALVRFQGGQDCLTTSERCRLEIVTRDGKTEQYPPAAPLARMTLIMGQMNRYAANLKALVEADTAREVEVNVNAALASTQNLAQTLAALQGGTSPPVPQFATPVGAAVNWVVGQYVEHVKFAGLQRATATAKPIVREAGGLFATTAGFVSDVARADLADEISRAVDTFRTSGTKANLAALAQSAGRYDALLTATPQQLFQRMVAAHDALADSLQGENVTLVAAIARIEDFSVEAKKLVQILKDLQAIVPAKQGG